MAFLNPGFLGALSAVALPIVIFLMFRKKFKKVEWAAMEYLLRANRRTNRRLKIENLLLLLIRCLIVAFLVMMMTRPRIEAGAMIGPQGSRHYVLVLDTSYSTAFEHNQVAEDSTYLSRIKKKALGLMDTMSSDDEVSVVEMNTRSKLRYGPLLGPDENAKGVVRDLESSHFGGNFGLAIREAREAVAASKKANHLVYFLTDCQAEAFGTPGDKDNADSTPASGVKDEKTAPINAEKELRDLAAVEGVTIHVVNVGEDAVHNASVTRISSEEQKLIKGISARFQVEVTNFSSSPRPEVEVAFSVDGEALEIKKVADIGPYESKTADFEVKGGFKEPGHHYVSASITADQLRVDDTRHHSVEVFDSIRVLLVNGEPGIGLKNETTYLKFNLNPHYDENNPLAEAVGQFRPEVVADTDFSEETGDKCYKNIARYDILVFCNVDGLQTPVARAVQEFIENGRSVVFFVGDQLNPENYNAILHNGGRGFFPCRLNKPSGYDNFQKWVVFEPTTQDMEHPIFNILEGTEQAAGFLDCVTYKYYSLEDLDTTPGTRAILHYKDFFDDSSQPYPAIVERNVGKGKCVLFNTTADKEWTELPSNPFYVYILWEMMFYLAYHERTDLNLGAGEPIRKKYAWDYAKDGVMTVARSTIGEVPREAISNEKERLYDLDFEDTAWAGLYTWRAKRTAPVRAGAPEWEKKDLQIHFCVNVDPAEGNLFPMSEQEFKSRFKGVKVAWENFNPTAGAADDRENESGKNEIWKYLAYAALGFLLLESVLAQRFGNYNR